VKRNTATLVPALLGLLACARAVLAAELWIEPRCTLISTSRVGPFVNLSDGRVMTIDGNATRTSSDDGKSWSEPRPIYDGPKPGIPGNAAVMLRTSKNVVVLVYADLSTFKWGWDKDRKEPIPDAQLDVWSIRSLDEGQTWVDRHQILDGYCGALIDMIETSGGRLVAPIQDLFRNPGRHEIRAYHSDDQGKTWRATQFIDLGGHGHHDGALEPTLAELSDGRLWMLIRTNWDYFWEAFSEDKGVSWRVVRPSSIDASSAPGFLLRLQSGRLALVWNRLYPEGQTETSRRGGDSQLSRKPASWHRGELSLAFSEDDGKSWTKPVVIARKPGGGLSYAYLFERRPGELWVSTRYSDKICVRLKEADFVGK